MAYGFISDYETLKPRQSTCDVALAWLLYQFDLPIVLSIGVAPSILLTIGKTAKEVTECMAGIKATASIPRTPMYEVTPRTQASVGKHWLRKGWANETSNTSATSSCPMFTLLLMSDTDLLLQCWHGYVVLLETSMDYDIYIGQPMGMLKRNITDGNV